MGNSPTPPGLLERILLEVDKRIAAFARSGFLRNARITQGGITVVGGFVRVRNLADTISHFFAGGSSPLRPDGSLQPVVIIRREDGTAALAMFDPNPGPTDADYKQFLALYDRSGNIYASDDTDSGQGMARPYLSGGFAASRFTDFRYSVTGATFVTVAHMYLSKQQPRMRVRVLASMDTAGTTGELQVLVDGVPLGPVTSEGFAISTRDFGPLPFAGSHMQTVHVEIQGRVTSGSGALKIEPMRWETIQS